MELTIIFSVVSVIAVIWFIVSGFLICGYLEKNSFKINYLFIRLFLPLYVHQYKTLTADGNGKPGHLYYHWLVSINTAWVFGIAAIIAFYN